MASEQAKPAGWKFVHFGLIVTGKGERDFLGRLLRALTESGHCTFEVVARVGQLTPRTSKKPRRHVVGTDKGVPNRDQEIGLYARGHLQRRPDGFVLLVDDLEHDRAPLRSAVFARYRAGLNELLGGSSWRAGVFFLVNMLEAYYFAHAAAINAVLGTELADHPSDVETIVHPKNTLKHLVEGFDEVRHGAAIVETLDTSHVLSRIETCAALRALFAWCSEVIGDDAGERFQLALGAYEIVTGRQLVSLEEATQTGGPDA